MKTYEEYKVSGVKWLGKVPKHWEICRFKDFISLQTQTSLSENKIGLYNPQNHPSTFSKRSVSILRFFSKTKRLF